MRSTWAFELRGRSSDCWVRSWDFQGSPPIRASPNQDLQGTESLLDPHYPLRKDLLTHCSGQLQQKRFPALGPERLRLKWKKERKIANCLNVIHALGKEWAWLNRPLAVDCPGPAFSSVAVLMICWISNRPMHSAHIRGGEQMSSPSCSCETWGPLGNFTRW